MEHERNEAAAAVTTPTGGRVERAKAELQSALNTPAVGSIREVTLMGNRINLALQVLEGSTTFDNYTVTLKTKAAE